MKEMGIKNVSSKTKNELILIIKQQEEKDQDIKHNVLDNKLTDVLKELLTKTPKDKSRKVCKNCNELGHSITSVSCKINIENNNKLKQKIKKYMLSQNCLENKTIEDYCGELSVLLDISPNLCKTLYNEIPVIELLDRQMNMDIYLKDLNHLSKKCHECDKNMICIQINTYSIWNGSDICDTCW